MKFPFLPEKNDEEVFKINIDDINPNPFQPRQEFNQREINELAESIKNYGVIQPVVVREDGERYELIAGERRLRACVELEMKQIPAIIRELDDAEVAEIALVENLQRKDLNFLEEALAYEKLLSKFSFTQQKLAEKIGKSQSTIANKLRILSLPVEVRKEIDPAIITERHARSLLKLKKKEEQIDVIKEIKEKKLTVKDSEKLIKKKINKREKSKEGKKLTVFKDLRIFINTLRNSINEMKEAGLDVEVKKKEDNDWVEYLIRLPKQKK